jgi:putative ABC transport system permease protein
MGSLWQDLRYAFRMLGRSPGFAGTVVLTLALGIGVNSALFSVVHDVLLKPLPYPNPERLVQVQTTVTAPDKPTEVIGVWSYPWFELLREHGRVFAQIAACAEDTLTLTQGGDPERVGAELVSGDYFPLFGLKPQLGRVFEEQEDRTPSAHPVAVISDGFWHRRFGSQADVIGQTVCLNKTYLTIVGVLPAWFKGQLGSTEIWVPISMAPVLQDNPERLTRPATLWHQVLARLNPQISLAAAQAAMAPLEKQIEIVYPMPDQTSTWGIRLASLQKANTDPAIRRSLLVLFAAVGFVLLITCVNVAGLLLARGISRQGELATRMALGATRARVIRQLLIESLVLSAGAGVLALLFAREGIDLMAAFRPADSQGFHLQQYARLPDFGKIRLGTPVLLFNSVLALVCGVIFGLVPALRSARRSLAPSLRGTTESAPMGTGSSPRLCQARSLLVVGQTALAIVLLVGAGLMLQSFVRLMTTKIGFQPAGLLTLLVNAPQGLSGGAWGSAVQQVEQRVASIPGVTSACVADATPLSGSYDRSLVKIRQPESENGQADVLIGVHRTSPAYLRTLQVPLLAGRWLTEQDVAGAKRVVVINEAMARRYWRGTDPVGQELDLSMAIEPGYAPVEIVGVVGDVKYDDMAAQFGNDIYVPYLQSGYPCYYLTVRTGGNPLSLVAAVRQAVTAVERELPVSNVMTMAQRIANSASRTKFIAVLLASFAVLAMAVAVTGLYGLIAYSVAQRTREIGIRMALGAQSSQVLRLTLRQGMRLVAAGGAIGVAAALALTRLMRSLLYEVSAADPLTFAAVALLLAFAALLACYFPARRAARIDPMAALRCE